MLKGYYDAIHAVNPDAVMICEHFCWDDEQRVLAQHGIKVWRQINGPYAQAAMGHQNDSDFSGFHTDNTQMPFGSYVSFMESHDEERLCYKQTKWGNGAAKTDLNVRMDRAGLCAAFSLLVPGPKMIWQFGELGYDYSINQNEKGEFHETEEGGYRTSMKPLRWDYYDDGVEGKGEDEVRRGLYDTYRKLLAFRKQNAHFYDMGAEFRWYVSTDNWPGRYLFIKSTNGANMALFGNFGSGNQTIGVQLPHDGTWYNAFTGDTWNGANHDVPMKEGQFYLLVDRAECVLPHPGYEPKPEGPGPAGGSESCKLIVKVSKSIEWYDKYIYAWDSNETALSGNWPGTKMDYDGEEGDYYVYHYNFAKSLDGKTINYIINGGENSGQTNDLSVKLNGATTTVTVKASDVK